MAKKKSSSINVNTLMGWDDLINQNEVVSAEKELIKNSVDNVRMGKLTAIPDLSRPEPTGETIFVRRAYYGSQATVCKTLLDDPSQNYTRTYTIVLPAPRAPFLVSGKTGNEFLDIMMHVSTLPQVLKKIEQNYFEMLTAANGYDGSLVVFIPNIGLRNSQKKGPSEEAINLIILIEPKYGDVRDRLRLTPSKYITAVVSDVAAAAMKFNCPRLVIDPYPMKVFKKYDPKTIDIWLSVINNERIQKQLHDVIFATRQHEDFLSPKLANLVSSHLTLLDDDNPFSAMRKKIFPDFDIWDLNK